MATLIWLLFGLCATAVLSQDRIEGTVPTNPSATIPPCADHSKFIRSCKIWKSRGYCTSSRNKSFMEKYCRRSCGVCGECVDVSRSCPTWKSRGHCEKTSRYYKYMEINCKKTCGKCRGGDVTTKIPTNPTTRPSSRPSTEPPTRPPTTPACADHSKFIRSCKIWKSRGYCTSSRNKSFMEKYCRRSCGVCGECVDVSRSCPTWKSRGHCEKTSRYYKYMEINCKKTCGKCKGGKVTTKKPNKPTTRPSSRPSTEPPTRPPTTPACADHSKFIRSCKIWKSRGYCTNSQNKSFMEKYCRRSCGLCGGGKVTTKTPTTQPIPQPTTPDGESTNTEKFQQF